MADRTGFVTHTRKTIGDIAVDGLFSGMGAGLAMAGLLLIGALLDGTGIAGTLGRFDPGAEGSPVVGALLHLAVSGLYGVLFAVVYHVLRQRWAGIARFAWLLGAAYGLGLWLTAHFVLLSDLNLALTAFAPWQFALAHLVYGTLLGYLMERHAAR